MNTKNIIGLAATAYLLETKLSKGNREIVRLIQADIDSKFPGTIWKTPPHNLHITLTTLIDPFFDYGENKDQLFEKIYPTYEKVLEEIFSKQPPFRIIFDEIKVMSDAIIMIGKDNGEFEKMREEFSAKISTLPKMKKPPRTPDIIHSTIARITKKTSGNISNYALARPVSFAENVTSFQLVKEKKLYALDVEILKTYALL